MQQSPESRGILVRADAKACNIARNRLVEAFPEQSTAAFRLFCYALDPEQRDGGGTVRAYARLFGLSASSVASTWLRSATRANLITWQYAPRFVLTSLGLVRVRALLETGARLSEVSRYLGYSSPQSLGRTIRLFRGVTPGAWRSATDARSELEAFVRHLIPFAQGLSLISDAHVRRFRTTASTLDLLPPLRKVAEGGVR